MLPVLADPHQGRSSCSRKMARKIHRVTKTISDQAGVQRYSKCSKAQRRLSPQFSCWGWQDMAITGYVDPWSKTMLLQTALRRASPYPGMKPLYSFPLSLFSALCHIKGILTQKVSQYYKYLVLKKMTNAFKPGDPVLELAALGQGTPVTVLETDDQQWIRKAEQSKIDAVCTFRSNIFSNSVKVPFASSAAGHIPLTSMARKSIRHLS